MCLNDYLKQKENEEELLKRIDQLPEFTTEEKKFIIDKWSNEVKTGEER